METSNTKRLMVLGAGINQVPLIKKAVNMGYYVITVDYLPDNIGHTLSHASVNCSTVDKEGILSVARSYTIDGIVTMASDVATPAVGYVRDQLGLPGSGERVANILSHKGKFREFQQKFSLSNRYFVQTTQLETVLSDVLAYTMPLVFKPVDTSGSRGITKVTHLTTDTCEAAFNYARRHSRTGAVCIEDFVDGIETSGDGILVDGILAFVQLTKKHTEEFAVTGHELPNDFSTVDYKRICETVVRHCNAIGYSDGPIDFDIRVSPTEATIIEMSPRLGGNYIPRLIEHATSVDLVSASIHQALGIPVDYLHETDAINACGVCIFGSSHSGVIATIASASEIKKAVPEVFDCSVSAVPGDEIHEYIDSSHSVGHALFNIPSAEKCYNDIVVSIYDILNIQIKR